MVETVESLDLVEAGRLQDAVTKMENALYFDGDLPAGAAGMIRRFLDNAKQRIATIEIQKAGAEKENREHERQEFIVDSLVSKETALNSDERKEYAGFLNKEFFAKTDFNSLAHFYTHSWDKLTEDGKEQMSHRVWEGVRHGEYKFQELPDIVKEKEAASLYDVLRKDKKVSPELHAIPIEDRKAFLDAWANKDCRKAYEILDRPSFKENVAKGLPQSVKSESVAVVQTETAESVVQTEKREDNTSRKPTAGNAIGETDLKLDDLKLVSADAGVITPPLPGGGGARVR